MKAILTYDLGTTGLKTALFDPADGRLLALAEREIPVHRPSPTWAEQRSEHWWEAVLSTTHAVLAAAPAGYQVAGIGLSSQRETVVPVDEAGEPLGPAVLWMDRRALAEAGDLALLLGAAEIHQVTGMVAEPTFTAPKLLWLKDNQRDVYRQARWFLCPKDFLGMRLTGAPFLDPSMASRTALYDTRRRAWWPAALEALDLSPERLAPVVPSAAPGGYLSEAAASALGLPAGIPVAAGGGDRCCEALGAAVGGGRVMESTGTATNLSAVAERLGDRLPEGILVTAHVVDGWLLEQGISTGGSVLKWLRDSVTGLPYAELDRLAASSRPGAGGLLLLPFFLGARATRWHPEARGVLFGLTLGHEKGDLARAVMEGVACEVRACLDVLAREGIPASELVSLGGGAASPLWRQIKADVTGRPVAALQTTHAASFGAMLLGAAAAGLISDPLAAARRMTLVAAQAEPRHPAFYSQLYNLYNQLYRSVEGLYGELAALAESAPDHESEV